MVQLVPVQRVEYVAPFVAQEERQRRLKLGPLANARATRLAEVEE